MIESAERRLLGAGVIQGQCTGMNPYTGHYQRLAAINLTLLAIPTYSIVSVSL